MKIKYAALIYFCIAMSCAGQPKKPPVTVTGDLPLSQLSQNPAFVIDESGNFETVSEATEKIRIYIHKFSNKKDLQAYVLNRRMLLHNGFQEQIAPYFGLIQLNKACLAMVDTKGEPQVVNAEEEFIKMRFPANDSTTLSDCSTAKFWGSIEYHFHNCRKTSTLYEIRISRKEGDKPAVFQPSCT